MLFRNSQYYCQKMEQPFRSNTGGAVRGAQSKAPGAGLPFRGLPLGRKDISLSASLRGAGLVCAHVREGVCRRGGAGLEFVQRSADSRQARCQHVDCFVCAVKLSVNGQERLCQQKAHGVLYGNAKGVLALEKVCQAKKIRGIFP